MSAANPLLLARTARYMKSICRSSCTELMVSCMGSLLTGWASKMIKAASDTFLMASQHRRSSDSSSASAGMPCEYTQDATSEYVMTAAIVEAGLPSWCRSLWSLVSSPGSVPALPQCWQSSLGNTRIFPSQKSMKRLHFSAHALRTYMLPNTARFSLGMSHAEPCVLSSPSRNTLASSCPALNDTSWQPLFRRRRRFATNAMSVASTSAICLDCAHPPPHWLHVRRLSRHVMRSQTMSCRNASSFTGFSTPSSASGPSAQPHFASWATRNAMSSLFSIERHDFACADRQSSMSHPINSPPTPRSWTLSCSGSEATPAHLCSALMACDITRVSTSRAFSQRSLQHAITSQMSNTSAISTSAPCAALAVVAFSRCASRSWRISS
mmetsp:Transcript_37140/g.116884  ORF Transcript_37140/g.116884 Transcript_37140/m.116884 type:complete len:382 (+) Transcript_37140:1718-2863(+)